MGGGSNGSFGNTKGNSLDALSNLLAAASLIPGLDTFTNLASIPVDLARGDFLSAGLSAFGVIPIVGEIGDVAKYADKGIDVAKTIDKANDAGKTVKATKHGASRLRERGFSTKDISTTKNTRNIKRQSDGAKVYIKEVSKGKYNVIVEGERGIITALKNISKKSLDRLTKNYNWR